MASLAYPSILELWRMHMTNSSPTTFLLFQQYYVLLVLLFAKDIETQ